MCRDRLERGVEDEGGVGGETQENLRVRVGGKVLRWSMEKVHTCGPRDLQPLCVRRSAGLTDYEYM